MKKMGIISRIKSSASNLYKKVDTKVGGRLPGGVPLASKQTSQPSPSPSPQPSKTPSNIQTTKVNLNVSKQSSQPLPYQSRGTRTDLAPQVPDSVKEANKSYDTLKGSDSSSSSGGTVTALSSSPSIQKNYDPREGMSFSEKAKQAGRSYINPDFYLNVAQQATGAGNNQAPNPLGAFKTFLSPLDVFGSTKTQGDVRGLSMGGTYTGELNQQTGQFEIPQRYRGQTSYERLSEQAIINPDAFLPAGALSSKIGSQVRKDLIPKYQSQVESLGQGYQSRINTGELSVDEANKLLGLDIKNIQGQYSTEANALYQSRLSPALRQSYGFDSQVLQANKPFYPSVSGTLATGGIIGSGFLGGGFALPVFTITAIQGGSDIYGGIANKNYGQSAFGLALFAGGTFGAIKAAANEVTLARIEGATSQKPILQRGTRFQLGENYFKDESFYLQSTGSAKAITRETSFIQFKPESNSFKILSGSSETTIATQDFYSGRNLFVGSYKRFTGEGLIVGKGSLLSRGQGFAITSDQLTPSIFRLDVKQQYSYKFFDSLGSTPKVKLGGKYQTIFGGGESNYVNDQILGRSGRFQRGDLSYDSLGGINVYPQSVSYQPEAYSVFNFKQTQEGFSVVKIGRGGKGSGGFGYLKTEQIETFVPPVSTFGQTQSFKGSSASSFTSAAAFEFAFQQQQFERQRGFQQDFTFSAQSFGFSQKELTRQVNAPSFGSAQGFSLSSSQGSSQPQIQIPNLGQGQTNDLISVSSFGGNPFAPLILGGSTPFFSTPFIGGLVDLPRFETGFPRSGRLPPRFQQFKYTPDFNSLIFNIRGKQPKGGASPDPFAARPIPRGFSFQLSNPFARRRKRR